MASVPQLSASPQLLIETARHLPAAPQVLAEINELLLDPHLQLDDVVDVLRRDAALAATVVRISNSALYGGARIGSIEDAVARVGLAEVYRVVGLATTARFTTLALPSYGVPAGALARNALLHALAAESIASLSGVDALVAYTAGLLRPLGMIVIDQLMRPTLALASPPFAAKDFVEVERQAIGRGNGEVAALVLNEWRFAPELVEGVRAHYLTGDLLAQPRLAVVLNLAGRIVTELGGALAPETAYWTADEARLEVLGLTREDLAAAQERTYRQFDRQRFAIE
ncbi:MAG TPA: HDOD domain-containing protein [Candidatus Synoicihabitans sp.]|nr:HDOD domain-containing protein [Candidatus Synoicihabitans sp.]